MKFNVITIFPDLIFQYCNESILKRAQENALIAARAIDLRDFTTDRHQKVDDTPYGGGAGMVMKPEPVYRALERLGALRAGVGRQTTDDRQQTKLKRKKKNVDSRPSAVVTKRTVLLSPRGRQFDQRIAEEWSTLQEMTFVCGRYEGVDQRVVDHMVDEEISIGPYVLAGGELGALIIIEAIARLIPGVLGNPESLEEETFGTKALKHQSTEAQTSAHVLTCSRAHVEYPHYTKPADFKGWKVPDVLLSGDHSRILQWRKQQSEGSPKSPPLRRAGES